MERGVTDPDLDARFDAALAAGAQTREGELDLGRLLGGRLTKHVPAGKSERRAARASYGISPRRPLGPSTDVLSARLPLGSHDVLGFDDGIDGIEHDEHSQSRDHYVAWQRQRTLAMLGETDVNPASTR